MFTTRQLNYVEFVDLKVNRMKITDYITLVKYVQLNKILSIVKHVEKKYSLNQMFINETLKILTRTKKTVNSYKNDKETPSNKVKDLTKTVEKLKITTSTS